MLVKRIIYFIIAIVIQQSVFASSRNARVGLTLGGFDWGANMFGIVYDEKGLIPQVGWTGGGELSLFNSGFIISPHAFFWQKSNLSGFYGGPLVSLGNINTYHHKESSFLIGFGGEGGWLYRFPLHFDLGAALDLQATNQGIFMGVKLTAGYLIR